jgi:hypothetical protein
MPSKDAMPLVPTYTDTVGHVKTIIRAAVGDQLNRLYCVEQALQKETEIRYIGVLAPVIILNATAEETAGLAQGFAKGNATVKINATDEINKDFLVATFKDVNKKIRTKK